MTYVKTDWVDGSTVVSEALLDKMEQGIFDAHSGYAAALAGNPPSPVGQEGKWLRSVGGAMVWDVMAGGGGGLDWEGAWNAATAYVKGDVVTYNGIVYGAVNDSTGQTPPLANPFTVPLVTSLPASPVDGQECILTDSLTAPTYTWRLRYVAAKATNKWVFVGGANLASYIQAAENRASTAYGDLATVQQVTVPVAGDYDITVGANVDRVSGTGPTYCFISFSVGATAASDNWAASGTYVAGGSANAFFAGERTSRWTALAAAAVIRLQVRQSFADNGAFKNRILSIRPIAVGG